MSSHESFEGKTLENLYAERERYIEEIRIWTDEYLPELGDNLSATVTTHENKRDWNGDFVKVEILNNQTGQILSVSTFPFGAPEEPEDPTERKEKVRMFLRGNFQAMTQKN
jgi:hypothetical protein